MEKALKHKTLILVCLFTAWGLTTLRLVYFISLYDAPSYVSDQWGFLNPILNNASFVEAFFYQHGSHFAGLGNLLTYFSTCLFGFNPKVECYLVASLMSLSALLAIGLKYRITKSLTFFDILIPIVILNLHQLEVFTWLAHTSIVAFPLLLTLLTAWCTTLTHRAQKNWFLLLLFICALFTGYAFILSGLISLFTIKCLFTSKNKRVLLVSLSIQVFAWLWFMYMFQLPTETPAATAQVEHWWAYAEYIRSMLINFYGQLEPRKLTYAYLLVVLIIPLLLALFTSKKLQQKQKDALLFMALFSVVYVFLNTISRAGLGVYAATSPRYGSFLISGFLAAYFWLSLRIQITGTPYMHLVLAIFVSGFALTEFQEETRLYRIVKERNKLLVDWNTCYHLNYDETSCTQKFGISPLPPNIARYAKAIETFYSP